MIEYDVVMRYALYLTFHYFSLSEIFAVVKDVFKYLTSRFDSQMFQTFPYV